MGVRAKFNCLSKDEYGNVHLYAVVGGSPENEEFFAATPNGEVRLGIGNTSAAQQFEAGKAYYLDFTPAED